MLPILMPFLKLTWITNCYGSTIFTETNDQMIHSNVVPPIKSVSLIDHNKTIYFRQTWKDPRLALYYLNCSLNIDADFSSKIWLPDIYFINDKKSFMHDVTRKNRMFRIRSNFRIL